MNHRRLRCYNLAMSMTKAMPDLIDKWPRGYAYLSDQLKRAMSSVPLNIAEGNARRSYPDRKRFFTMALASASEVSAIIDIAVAYRLLSQSKSEEIQDGLLQVYKMLFKLK